MELFREFDLHGLELAEYQGQIFEESVERIDSSSLIFLRRFKKSKIARELDLAHKNLSLLTSDAFYTLEKEYPNSYGKNRYSKECMFWMGYIYRYICYTRRCSTPFVMELFKPQKLAELYYVYHTQSEEWVVRNLLELVGKDESCLNKNQRIKNILRLRYKNLI